MVKRSSSAKVLPDSGLTFDDVLLLPRPVSVGRGDVDLTTQLAPGIRLRLPVLSSPMDTVTEEAMAVAMAQAGGLGILHRNMRAAEQADLVTAVKSMKAQGKASVDARGRLLVGAAVGAGPDLQERVSALMKAGADVIVVDSAHGASKPILDAVVLIKKLNKKQVVMAGSVATGEAAALLASKGVDMLRVGIGPGSICTTRIVTGVGVPQITAVMEAARAVKGKKVTVVADGGIKQIGDMAKALGAGAHAVMLGTMLGGYDESPGEVIEIDGRKVKRVRGMGSISAMKQGAASRYGQSAQTAAMKLIPEGVEGVVPYRGPVDDFLYQVHGSLQSAFFYVGSASLKDFHAQAQFIRITGAGLRESHPHSITLSDPGVNYRL